MFNKRFKYICGILVLFWTDILSEKTLAEETTTIDYGSLDAGLIKNWKLETKTIIKVPKCCRDGFVLSEKKKCEEDNHKFYFDVDILEHNETHVNNESLDRSAFDLVPVYNPLKCKKFPLNRHYDKYFMLVNGSLIAAGDIGKVFSFSEFCTETYKKNETTYDSLVLLCLHQDFTIYKLFVICAILSTIFLALTVGIFLFKDLGVKDIHKYLMVLICILTLITFFILDIVLLIETTDTTCNVLGLLFQFFYIYSYCCLAFLCCDLLFILIKLHSGIIARMNKNHEEPINRNRIYWYMGLGIILPLASLFCLTYEHSAAVPNAYFKSHYNLNLCSFSNTLGRQLFFYIPIGFCLILGAAGLGFTYLLRSKYESNAEVGCHVDWLENRKSFKNMYMQGFLYWIVAFLSFLAHLTSLAGETSIVMIGGLIEMSQGINLFVIFVIYKYKENTTIKKNLNEFKRSLSRESKDESNANIISNGTTRNRNNGTDAFELEPLNNGVSDNNGVSGANGH